MSTSVLAKRYFDALAAHDLDAAVACWAPGGIDRLVGQAELTAPDDIRRYFAELFEAFPDFRFEIVDLTTGRGRTAVRWRARATFAGPGTFEGFAPNGARVELEGCDVVTVADGLIQHNDAYLDSGTIARQLGFLPPAGSVAQARLARLANARTKVRSWPRGARSQRIADGVWAIRGGFPLKTMNVYFIEDDGGVTMFDAGVSHMGDAVAALGARLGGIRRVVLGHADADHRGGAARLGTPIHCHPQEVYAAESGAPFRAYWDLSKLKPHARLLLGRLFRAWDGGALEVAGTVVERDRIGAFRVVEFPGHAPGLIGLFRESDRLALVSDCIYTLDVETGLKGPARTPHPAFNFDTERARDSVRKLIELEPAAVWSGHGDPVVGDVRAQLERAASGAT